MNDRRDLKRTERQLLLARIARRDAMSELAASLAEEQRSASLAKRSRELAKEYAERSDLDTGEALARQGRFAAELTGLARQADRTRGDASRQAEWQINTLAKAEQRIARLDERAKLARLQHKHTQERLEQEEKAAMARSLQKTSSKRSVADRSRKLR
ncbi:MAG: hypothetical protein AAGL10_07715 [Pseudomonadota bacterium]